MKTEQEIEKQKQYIEKVLPVTENLLITFFSF